MKKGSLFQKSLSLIMVIAVLMSLSSPAANATAELFAEENYADYVALGDSMTLGTGLDDLEDGYQVQIAEALAKAGKIDDAEDYRSYAGKKFRIEELRYLLDADYAGDGYTDSIGTVKTWRKTGEVMNAVTYADVITINAGTNNFSTYVVEQMVYYLENNGAVKYAYSFDEFGNEEVQNAMENIQSMVLDKLLNAAGDQGDAAIEMINYVAEVATYAVLSYITSFNAMVTSIYELNPDVELYIIGQYNPVQGEVLTYDTGSRVIEVPIGEFFGALVELANAYAQILAPRAYDYTYVDPGTPELLIDQMANTNLTDDQRIPDGLVVELIHLAGDAALNEVIDIFESYGLQKENMEEYAMGFLEDLVTLDTEQERSEYIRNEIQAYVNEEVIKTFKDELSNYLGQFADPDKEIVTSADIDKLLSDLDACSENIACGVGCGACQTCVAEAFVDRLIQDPDLQNQAAANVIYGYIEEYGLSDYVTVDNVVELLEDLRACNTDAQREAVADAWVHDLAVAKITEYVQKAVGTDKYDATKADAMLTKMENDPANAKAIARECLLEDVFHDYMVEKFEDVFASKGLQLLSYNGDFDAFVTAVETSNDYKSVVRDVVRESMAAFIVDYIDGLGFGHLYDVAEIEELFAEMDAKTSDTAKKNYLKDFLNGFYNFVGESFWDFYVNYYCYAANLSINYMGEYLQSVDTAATALTELVHIQGSIVDTILDKFDEYLTDVNQTLEGVTNFAQLKADAVKKILDGYKEYDAAVKTAMESADSFGEYLDPVYEMLLDIAEVEKVSLNDLLAIGKKIQENGESYITDMADRIIVEKKINEDEKTAAYLALRYYLGNAMMIMPSTKGHAAIAAQVIRAINGENTNSAAGDLANKVINGGLDIYHCAKEFLSLPTTGSGQVGTLINPENYVAIGDYISNGDNTYVDLLADALAMNYKDDAGFDSDVINNLSIDGIRTVELLALLSNDFDGDAYTESRFGTSFIASKRAEFQAAIQDAELITLNIGINDLVTYPMNQALLAYNGEETYEMDWERFFSASRVNKVYAGKDAVMKLLLGIVDNIDSRVINPKTGKSAYDEAETALNTVATAVEALAYSLLNYAVNLDASVETIAELNPNATIVLVGFYNPMEDTYVNIDKTVSVGGVSVDLSKYTVDTSALTEKIINQANRFLTNYVGYIADDMTAADEGSRIVTVSIMDTELKVSDTDASKDLSTLTEWKTVSVGGKQITIKIPEYLYETLVTGGEALHPNANGHQYICDQILDALNFEIHADVVPEDNTKVYGENDPDFAVYYDDLSSLYKLVVNVGRIPADAEDVGEYDIVATVVENGGYAEIDLVVGTFTITARPITVDVVVLDGVITEVTVTEGTMAFDETTDVLNLSVNAEGTAVTANNANYDVTINATFETTEVMQVGDIKMLTRSLWLADEVHYTFRFSLEGFNMNQIEEIGLLAFYSKTDESGTATLDSDPDDTIFDKADEVYTWTVDTVVRDGERYAARTSGIPAKNLGDDMRFRIYVKLTDGTYCYSWRYMYDAVEYAKNAVSEYPNDKGLHAVCAAMLNYGSAAQVYFEHRTDDLMNSILDGQLSGIKGLVEEFNTDMIDARLPAQTSPHGVFGDRSAFIKPGSCSVTLLGAISLNAKGFTYTADNVTECGFLVWNPEIYASGEPLTQENAIKIECQPENGSFSGSITGIPAAGMADTYALAAYIVVDGNYHYYGVYRLSVDYYAEVIINGDYSETLKDVARYMVVYGEYAEDYFRP